MFVRLQQFARSLRDRDRVVAFLHFTWQRFLEDRCFQTAGALAYTSIFALVPLTAAVLGILAAFPGFAGWREQITTWVFDNFVPAAGSTVQGYITQFADSASKATAIGVLVLLFSAVSLMMSIEDAFNRIWRVQVARGATARFIIYWTALTLGPLLLVAALAISSYAFALPFIDVAEAQFSIKARVLAALPFLIVWAALIAAYVVIPNRSVRLAHAVIGALIAALLFEAAKRGFALYATKYASYQQVYGALALVPIFIFWVYLSWIVVLLGASITASLSAFDYRPADRLLPRGQEFTGLLRVMARFAAAQREGKGLHSTSLLASEPYLTDDQLQRYLGDLHRIGLIQRGELGEWMVVRDLAATDLLEVYEEGGYRLPLDHHPAADGLQAPAQRLLDALGDRLRSELAVPLAVLFPLQVPSPPETAPAARTPTESA
ncbi:YihY family inner membrane protein [Dokdonella sp.]|uniref:YihY family inner membrane protein n=1 Tax=Dokdonella sp. TaxID=2291710 RepID=UPI001B1CAA39|nr:YihY family inner membrane protein [Dokdonella sp.]MBO9663351.1 YihY family inner membrane protein [Dokdonella sp.]